MQGSVYGGHYFDMAGLPEYMQDEVYDADGLVDSVDNYKVLLDYGIQMDQIKNVVEIKTPLEA